MAKDIQTARWERAHKARKLYEAHAFEATGDGLLVFSETGQGCYLVTDAGCTCPDAVEGFAARLLGGHCKHRELAAIIARASQPGPKRLPPRDDDDHRTAILKPAADVDGVFKPERPRRLPRRAEWDR